MLSIARLTVSSTPADFAAKFAERLGALAASQDLLVLGNRQVVDMDNLVRSQLGHFRDLIGTRIQLTGPPVKVEPQAAQTIGMALHELATNAGKYGALSNAEGHVEIAWWLLPQSTTPARFEMSWTERSGPLVSAPVQHGFGSTIIKQVPETTLAAQVRLAYPPTGCVWHLSCDVSRLGHEA